MPEQLTDLEDQTLDPLARSVRARTGAAEGVAVRDTDGRTYAGATVALPSLQLSAVAVTVAMAVSSGSAGLEAVVVLGEADAVLGNDLSVIRDFAGEGVTVHRVDARGQLVGSLTT